MKNLKLYVDAKYNIQDVIIFKDEITHPLCNPEIRIGIIMDIEARLNKNNNQVYIVYTILTSETEFEMAQCDESNIIMILDDNMLKNLKHNYKIQYSEYCNTCKKGE